MSEIPAETVNKRLVRVREALKKTPADFAEELCLSRSYLYGLESENRAANDRIIKLVSLTFGASEHWLKTGEGEMFDKTDEEGRRKILALFDRLNPNFQQYLLRHVDSLLDLQDKERNQ